MHEFNFGCIPGHVFHVLISRVVLKDWALPEPPHTDESVLTSSIKDKYRPSQFVLYVPVAYEF